MARPGIIAGITVLLVAATLQAQEWSTYSNRIDRFEVNFPGQPKVEEIKWPSEYGAVFPGRVYSVEQSGSRYSVTVIDYTDAERIHAARTNHTEADSLPIYWQVDVQASIAYAATKFRQRPGVKVTYDAFHYIDLVSGHQLQMTNPDQSRTFAGIYLHESRLYILEATVPAKAPPDVPEESSAAPRCQRDGCSCEVRAGELWCSEACMNAQQGYAEKPANGCVCGHASCAAAGQSRPQHMAA